MPRKRTGYDAACYYDGKLLGRCTKADSDAYTLLMNACGGEAARVLRGKNDIGLIIPVVITVYADRSFSFITKTPPAAVLLKKACKIQSGSGEPNRTKVATISKADLQQIAETKMKDLNAASIEAAMSMIAGTARSRGITVEE